MSSIESEIVETFLAQLALVDDVPTAVTDQLGELLAADKLPKTEKLVSLYSELSGENLL